jgi:hypothetical protein
METQVRHHPQLGPCLWNIEAREYVLDNDGKPAKADARTGLPVDEREYTAKTLRIGALVITMDKAGTVLFHDPTSKFPPIECIRMGKVRAIFSALQRALSKVEHPDISIKIAEHVVG